MNFRSGSSSTVYALAAKLQKTANGLGLNKLSTAAAAPTVAAYDATFTQGLVVCLTCSFLYKLLHIIAALYASADCADVCAA